MVEGTQLEDALMEYNDDTRHNLGNPYLDHYTTTHGQDGRSDTQNEVALEDQEGFGRTLFNTEIPDATDENVAQWKTDFAEVYRRTQDAYDQLKPASLNANNVGDARLLELQNNYKASVYAQRDWLKEHPQPGAAAWPAEWPLPPQAQSTKVWDAQTVKHLDPSGVSQNEALEISGYAWGKQKLEMDTEIDKLSNLL